MSEKTVEYKVAKADGGLGLVFGWAQVCMERTEKGLADFYDSDNQCFEEEATVKAWAAFMEDVRVLKANHRGEQIGDVVFAFPFTSDIAKSLGFDLETIPRTGVLTAVKPPEDILAKYVSGEWDSFSVGGVVNSFEEYSDAI